MHMTAGMVNYESPINIITSTSTGSQSALANVESLWQRAQSCGECVCNIAGSALQMTARAMNYEGSISIKAMSTGA